MSRRDIADLLLLGALWGASFLLMRLGAGEFGPLALVFVRVAGASLMLLPWLAWHGEMDELRRHWRPLAVVGLLNSALPFALFMVAALVLGAGLMAVFNATSPIWAALIAALWLGERMGPAQRLGLAIGVAGVAGLVWDRIDLRPGEHGVSPALGMAACVLATLSYGIAANFTRHRLAGVPSRAVAAGSQFSATLMMMLPAALAWPAVPPSATAWAAAAVLALACTGLAYLLYFRLIASAGASKAISVTFLIPAFAMAWGWLVMDERPTAGMLLATGVILLGTALATGVLKLPERAPREP